MHLVAIGGSDAGISAALRARELDPGSEVTVIAADAYPNFSICGIPYYVSGEVGHWRNLAHRSIADLEAAGMRLRVDTTARRIDVPRRKLLVTSADGAEEVLGYDKLVVGTGAVPVRPPVGGLSGTTVRAVTRAAPGRAGRLEVQATTADGTAVTRATDMVLVVTGVRPDTALAAGA